MILKHFSCFHCGYESNEKKISRRKHQSTESMEELIKQYQEKTKINAAIFDGIKVKKTTGEEIYVKEIWKKRPMIVKVLARLGCTLCMHEAKIMSDLQPFFESQGIGLAAIVFEDVDLKNFLSGGYWKWDIYIDPNREVYAAAGLTKVSRKYHMSCMVSKYIMQLMVGLNLKGMVINFKGDLRQLGGTFVITPDNEIVYDFRPKKFAAYPSMKEIYQSIGGDPDEIDEELPEQYIFTQKKLAEDTIRSRNSWLFSYISI